MAISRRQFCEGLVIGGALGSAPSLARDGASVEQPSAVRTGSHLGNLYPFVQAQADRSTFELSFLRSEFKDLRSWQRGARARVFEHLFYAPPRVDPKPELIRRTDRGDYVEEYLTLQTTPDLRIPAYVLMPKKARIAAPGIVVLHDHDGIYLWGKEKVVAGDQEHPPHDVQAAALRRQEHRLGARAAGLRDDRDRHVLLGRAADDPGRRPGRHTAIGRRR